MRLAHVPCYYSGINAQINAFGLQLFPYYAQHNRLKPSSNVYVKQLAFLNRTLVYLDSYFFRFISSFTN